MQLVQQTVVAGRFRLVQELGRGGMGSVWRAHHLGLNIPCAIKFMRDEAAALPENRARFAHEAQAAARLRSPNIVQILDYGVWEGVPHIAMELLEGEDLAKRLERRGRLPLHEVAAIVGQVARALAKAHAGGLVHRDIKPANIFLVHDDDGEIAKVLDFGIAKQTQPSLTNKNTKTGSLLGTPYYMSPEQARGTKTIDYRADLWSLAVIAYQCVVGRLPFEGDSFGDLVVQIVFSPLPVPSQVAAVPPGFDAWWAHAVAREPEERFQSARAMAEALAQVAELPRGAGEFASRIEFADFDSTPTLTAPGAPLSPVPGAPLLPTSQDFSISSNPALDVARFRAIHSTTLLVVIAVAVLGLAGSIAFMTLRGTISAAPTPAAPDAAEAQSEPTSSATPAPDAPPPHPTSDEPPAGTALPDPNAAPPVPRAPRSAAGSPPGQALRVPKPRHSAPKPSAPTRPRYDDGI